MKDLSITILGKSYKVSLDDGFKEFLQRNIQQDLGSNTVNDTKILLNAYIKRCHELYVQDKEIKDIHSNLEQNTK